MGAVIQTSVELSGLIETLTDVLVRLTAGAHHAADVHVTATGGRGVSGRLSAIMRPSVQALNRCRHSEGHELSLNVDDALSIETCRECPCCAARLWISIPSVGAILDAAASKGACGVPGLQVELTPRERQLLNVLHRSSYALRHKQLAALVWSDPDRTHDVRSALYRLRRKLLTSGWAIPVPPKGKGVRLVPTPRSEGERLLPVVRHEQDVASDSSLGDAA